MIDNGDINVHSCWFVVHDRDVLDLNENTVKDYPWNIYYWTWGKSSHYYNGRVKKGGPPLLGIENVTYADSLPQALLLTAIVINFATTALFLVLSYRAYTVLGTDDTEQLRGKEDE